MIRNFCGNREVVETLEQMLHGGRLPQTILLAGPEGVGKATLVRRFAAALVGDADKIERDDLSLEGNAATAAEREKLPADKRNEDPLLFASHPDFVTFPPDGPLRQISIQQIRALKERAPFKPLKGARRVFLIDHLDRANEQAANSLLKILEEPPAHLVLMATAENLFDLLPTIRSRSVILNLVRLEDQDMRAFLASRGFEDVEKRIALAAGSPGLAVSMDVETYERRRAAMLVLLDTGAKRASFTKWQAVSEKLGASKSEKLEEYLKILYGLLEDVLLLKYGAGPIRNRDVESQLAAIASAKDFGWIRYAVQRVDELVEFVRRNIQKSLALDALAVDLQAR